MKRARPLLKSERPTPKDLGLELTEEPKISRIKVRMDNAWKKEENKIVLWRGAVIPIEDLIQFDKWKGRKLFTCFLMSTSTQL